MHSQDDLTAVTFLWVLHELHLIQAVTYLWDQPFSSPSSGSSELTMISLLKSQWEIQVSPLRPCHVFLANSMSSCNFISNQLIISWILPSTLTNSESSLLLLWWAHYELVYGLNMYTITFLYAFISYLYSRNTKYTCVIKEWQHQVRHQTKGICEDRKMTSSECNLLCIQKGLFSLLQNLL